MAARLPVRPLALRPLPRPALRHTRITTSGSSTKTNSRALRTAAAGRATVPGQRDTGCQLTRSIRSAARCIRLLPSIHPHRGCPPPASATMSTVSTSRATVAHPIADQGLLTGRTRIGWIGTGVMGVSMCRHVCKPTVGTDNSTGQAIKSSDQPYPTYAYSRTIEKLEPLKQHGVTPCASVDEVAQNSDIVFTMVGFPSDVEEIYYGSSKTGSKGILASMGRGGIVVDMTTSEPTLAQRIAADAASAGIHALDAPVSGGDVGAREAKLSIMIGGEQKVMYAILPLLQSMGKNITYCGGVGHGQHTKMMNQILIANNMIGVCEGLLYAHKSGLDLSTAIAAVSTGAAGSWSINNLGPRIVKRDMAPGFFVDHFVKDMGIALAEAARMRLSLPGLSLARQLYIALQAQGHGQSGTQALVLALEKLNNIETPNDQPMAKNIHQQQ